MPPDRWQSAADALRPKRLPTPLERQAIAEVHDLACRFGDGSVGLEEVRAACSGRQRWLATRFTGPKDAAFRPLMAMLDALIADEPNRFATKHGNLHPEDLYVPPARVLRNGGQELIQFPVRWPWRVKPDPDRGIDGERGEPIYRRPEDRGPTLGSFGHPQPAERKTPEPEWWEAASTEDVPF